MSRAKNDSMDEFVENREESLVGNDGDVGLCLGCGHRLTLCGAPFTADVVCCKCNKLNKFVESKQPVSITVMDGCVFA